MQFDAAIMSMVAGLMVLANKLVDALALPIFEKYDWNKFWLMYVAWGFSGVLVALAGINLFEGVFTNDIVGLVLTAIVAGGGANLLHDATDKPNESETK